MIGLKRFRTVTYTAITIHLEVWSYIRSLDSWTTCDARGSVCICACISDEVFPVEKQPLPAAVSPTANSPGYIADSDPEKDEDDPEEDPEEDPIDYPADGGDDDDDDDESSDDDEDDDDEEKDKDD
ncbi:hypothetical protein Tco_0408770 [Tanacetum coccineum]